MPAKPAPKKNLSALKKVRQSEKHRLRNQSVETSIKTYTKKLEVLLESTKNKEEIDGLLKRTIGLINSAASKGAIHRNTASRRISRIAKKVQSALNSGG